MKAALRTVCLSFIFIVGMGIGTNSNAEDAAAEPTAPAGYKLIPEDLTADLNLTFYSQYIWRGYELSRDSLVIFPQLTVGYKGFAVTTWVDLDTRHVWDENKKFKLQETDVIASYSNSIAPLKLNYTLGWILYDWQPTKNQELFVTLGLDTILNPTLSVYQEIEVGHAWYFQLGVAHSFPVYKDWSLDLAATASFMHNTAVDDENLKISAFHDGNLSAGLKIPINNYLSIKPNLQWSFPLSSAASGRIKSLSVNGRHNTFVYGGIILDLAI